MRWPSPRTSLPQPYEDPNLTRTFAGYRSSLQRMTVPELQEHLTTINVALQSEAQARLASQISAQVSGYPTTLDSPVVRSLPMGPQRPSGQTDRGSGRSPASPPPPSAIELLARSKSLAPRVAGKLVLAEAKRQAKVRE